jgi:hypothetical protein
MATVSQSGECALTLAPFTYMICAHSTANVYPVAGGPKLRYGDRCINTTINPGQQQRLDFTLTALLPVHLSGSASGAPEGSVPGILRCHRRRTPANARATYTPLGEFGVPLQGIRPEDFTGRGSFFRFGREPRGFDIRPAIPGIEFDPAWDHRVENRD